MGCLLSNPSRVAVEYKQINLDKEIIIMLSTNVISDLYVFWGNEITFCCFIAGISLNWTCTIRCVVAFIFAYSRCVICRTAAVSY